MINCCDEISDPTLIHVASRIAQDHDPIEAGSFVESDPIEKSWADEKLVIRSHFHSVGSFLESAQGISSHSADYEPMRFPVFRG